MHIDFNGRRALVTGASRGIGRTVAKLLGECGAQVIVLGRDRPALERLREEIGCRVLIADLADVTAVQAAAQAALPVDLLVNCAGVVTLEPFLDTSVETLDHTLAINLRAPMILAQVVARDLLRRAHSGAMVNVSSLAAMVGTPEHTAYCASKAALDAMTRVMARELGSHGIRVNSVDPVVTLTPMADQAWSDPAKSGPMLARIPLGRFAEPLEVAHAIVYLLSDQAGMIHGVSLPVDGGFLAG